MRQKTQFSTILIELINTVKSYGFLQASPPFISKHIRKKNFMTMVLLHLVSFFLFGQERKSMSGACRKLELVCFYKTVS